MNEEGKAKIESKQPNRLLNISTICKLIRYTVQAGCVIIFFTMVICNTRVVSGSMEPTLMTGDIAIYNRLAYKWKNVQRGDIITFWFQEEHAYLGKRVIGIAGDTIEFQDGNVYINGLLADESQYLDENVETYSPKTFLVPEGCVFVLGDNRENSYDSRHFENPYISLEDIVGKCICILR